MQTIHKTKRSYQIGQNTGTRFTNLVQRKEINQKRSNKRYFSFFMERRRVMENYNIPKEISTELKINKSLYLFDLLFIIGLLMVTMMLRFFIHPTLQIPFYIFMGIFGLLMIVRPSTNPKKRMYEALLLTLVRKRARIVPLIGIKNKKEIIINKKKPSLVERMVLNGESKLKFSNFMFIISKFCKL